MFAVVLERADIEGCDVERDEVKCGELERHQTS
jgi:hypothetical protein